MTDSRDSLQVRFCASLPAPSREQLERLAYAHPLQGRMRKSILDHARAYGDPRLVQTAAGIRLSVSKIPDVQNLFAVNGRENRPDLLGFVLYVRTGEWLDVLFLAVQHAYVEGESGARLGVAYRIMDELTRIAGLIRGIAGVRLVYRPGVCLILKGQVRNGPSA